MVLLLLPLFSLRVFLCFRAWAAGAAAGILFIVVAVFDPGVCSLLLLVRVPRRDCLCPAAGVLALRLDCMACVGRCEACEWIFCVTHMLNTRAAVWRSNIRECLLIRAARSTLSALLPMPARVCSSVSPVLWPS